MPLIIKVFEFEKILNVETYVSEGKKPSPSTDHVSCEGEKQSFQL